jgi:putative SOS response-associated peptidase YedK
VRIWVEVDLLVIFIADPFQRLFTGAGPCSRRAEEPDQGAKSQAANAIAMKDGSPFGLGGLWENWKDPTSGEWIRTFAIITTDANELVADIHDRMPLVLAPADYARWLSDEPDPRDLMRPFPADPMRMWPISTRVNKPENDEPSILDPITTLVA